MRFLVASLIACTWVPCFAAPERPNIVLILSDDHAAQAIGCYGSRLVKTPHLDRLAAGGVRFENTFCTESICGPSRAAILTGKYGHVTGARGWAPYDRKHRTFPEILREHGYQTALFGKYRLGKEPAGFDEWKILPGQGRYHDPEFLTAAGKMVEKGHVSDVIARLACDWLARRDETQPFLVCIQDKAAHMPFEPSARHRKRFETRVFPEPETLYDRLKETSPARDSSILRVENLLRWQDQWDEPLTFGPRARIRGVYQQYMREYAGCVAGIDDGVGRVLDWLDEHRLAQNTAVIYSSDQGFFLGEHGWFDKRWMLEECLRMPLIVRYPPLVKAGGVCESMVLNIDFAPTLLDLAGVAVPDDMQGRSLRPLLAGTRPSDWRRDMYYRYYDRSYGLPPQLGIRTERYKLIHYLGPVAVDDGTTYPRLENRREIDEWELFDLQADPDERNNLYGKPGSGPIAAALETRLYELQRELGDVDDRPHFVIVSKTHFDIGYSALARDVKHEYRTTMIDRALATIEENAGGELPGKGYVWTVPGWPMRTILWEGQHPERRRRVVDALRRGNLVLHALPYTLHTATGDVETLARSFIDSSSVAREFGLRLPESGKMTDVPGHDWILPTLLRHAGVRFFHFGANPTNVQVKLPRIFWWEGPDGSRVLTMYSSGYASGLLPPVDWPHKTWLAMVMSGDNQGPHSAAQVSGWIRTIRAKYPKAKITIGSLDDFASSFLAEKPELPVVRGTISDSWIHGPMSSPRAAKELMNVRPKLRALEALRTQGKLWGTKLRDLPEVIAKSYARSLRWTEHTWGLANQHYVPSLHGEDFYRMYVAGLTPNYEHIVESWKEHDSFALRIRDDVVPALEDDLHTLAESVAVKGLRMVVYNPLPWPRDGVVDFSFPFMASIRGLNAAQDVESGDVSPLKTWGAESHRNGRFVARDIPPLGYKTVVFTRKEGLAAPATTSDPSRNALENRYFRVVLDPERGCVRSITDKRTGRELVDASAPHGFGQYLYQQFDREECFAYTNEYILGRYHGSHRQITGKCTFVPESAKHVAFSPGPMTLHVEPLGYGLRAALIPAMPEGGGGHTAALVVTLYDELPYLDLTLSVVQHPPTENPEAGWLCLPFALKQPSFRIKGTGSIFDPAKDVIEGSNFAYFWTQGGLAVLDSDSSGVGIALPDCPAISLGEPGIYRFESQWDEPSSRVYVNLFNNKWNTNFRSFWSGDLRVRVRLWSIDSYDDEKHLTTPVAEALSPLLSGLSNYVAGALPVSAEGVRLSRKGVLLTAFGPNPDGEGTLLRVWEDAGRAGPLTITLPARPKDPSVQPVDLRGRPIGESLPVAGGAFTIELGAFQPASFVIDL